MQLRLYNEQRDSISFVKGQTVEIPNEKDSAERFRDKPLQNIGRVDLIYFSI